MLDGEHWRCTFADEFSGPSLDTTKWIVQRTSVSGFHSGKECVAESPDNVAVSGGQLKLTVRQEAAPFVCNSPGGRSFVTQYSSGSIDTWRKFSQAFGRFEVRARFPAAMVAGLQSAVWLYPQDLAYGQWPKSGEIDIAETYSNYPDRAIPYLHYEQTPGDTGVTRHTCKIKNLSAFHTYAAVWTRRSITITYDGKVCLRHAWNPASLTAPAPFDKPFFIALTQALGTGTNAFDPATTPLPATTEVDYVHVWS